MFDLKKHLKLLPEKPGVYLMKNKSDEVIYVGKAVSLKNRVRQYFQSSKNHPPKVRAMVLNIEEFEYIITDSEVEALILENNLIKKYKPKYNVLLKDDKQYPYIKITVNEKFPRLIKTRKVIKDGARYFGPYTQIGAVNKTIELLKRFYPLRTCGRNLDKISERPCLNYHINKCLGPCRGEVSHEEYSKMINEIILFLSGKHGQLLSEIENKMMEASSKMNFEKAAEYRDQMMAINSIKEKQKVVFPFEIDIDVIAMARGIENICVMIFFIRHGKLIGREHYMLDLSEEEERGEVISAFIKQFYSGTAFIPKEILIQDPIDDQEIIEKWLSDKRESKLVIKIPQKGEKRKFVEMVHKNAVEILKQFSEKLVRDQEKYEGALESLGNYLELDKRPRRIEAYDISNIQGVHAVASMVVFENGKAKYSDYRRFKIKTIEGPNDYGSMQEVIYRRLKRGIEGQFNRFPDVMLIDGGLGHVNAVSEVLNALKVSIPVAGMVKDEHHKTKDLIYQGRKRSIHKDLNVYQLIGRIQEEAHRFAISYHKSLRGKTLVQSVLDEIKGIGPKRKTSLLKHFGSIEKIKKASIDELNKVEGMNYNAAKEIYNFFLKKSKEE
ncbi:excinuclease ABC subunit UvrC [Lutibacter sp. B2]|nr:excinuclease ABC subunit UvrC [Lutibacter sp. B2]